jgi:hypothetical protein
MATAGPCFQTPSLSGPSRISIDVMTAIGNFPEATTSNQTGSGSSFISSRPLQLATKNYNGLIQDPSTPSSALSSILNQTGIAGKLPSHSHHGYIVQPGSLPTPNPMISQNNNGIMTQCAANMGKAPFPSSSPKATNIMGMPQQFYHPSPYYGYPHNYRYQQQQQSMPLYPMVPIPQTTISAWQRPPSRPRPPPPPAKLCVPMESPSPFANYMLLEVLLVRPASEKSFGVNLKLYHQSTLVDPEWIEQQQERKSQPKCETNSVKKEISNAISSPKVETTTSNSTVVIVEKVTEPKQDTSPVEPKTEETKMIAAKETTPKQQDEEMTDATIKASIDATTTSVKKEKANTIPSPKVETTTSNSTVFIVEKVMEPKQDTSPVESKTEETKMIAAKETTPKEQDEEMTDATIKASIDTTMKMRNPQEASASSKKNSSSEAEVNTDAPLVATSQEQSTYSSLVDKNPEPVKSVKIETPFKNSAEPVSVPSIDIGSKPDKDPAPQVSIPRPQVSDSNNNDNDNDGAAPKVSFPPPPKRRRRRRVNFSVMMVVDAVKQNGFRKTLESCIDGVELLQPHDIIVQIGGTPIAGLTFSEACGVFSSKAEPIGEESRICAKLLVARSKPKQVTPRSIKASKPPSVKTVQRQHQIATALPKLLPTNSTFQSAEIAILADCILQAVHPPNRLLGQSVDLSSETLFDPMTTMIRQLGTLQFHKQYQGKGLPLRSLAALQSKWRLLTQSMESDFRTKHQDAWKRAIAQEGLTDETLTFGSDAERSALRQLPRPVKGCRCKQNDHEYLHDPKCHLYRDICRLVPKDVLAGLLKSNEDKVKKKKDGDAMMKTVEKGFKDRIIRLKTLSGLEEAEARFVAKMEEVMISECKKAVFAPSSLAAMLLSAIFELQREFPVTEVPKIEEDSDDESDDEEGVTLAALGSKRKAANDKSPKGKRQKGTSDQRILNFKYYLRLLQYISKTWGHVYREPSHEEYAW